MPNQFDNDKLELIGRKRLMMSSVDSVDGFSQEMLNLTVAGIRVKVVGEKIKITAYNKATGSLVADGEFKEIKYLGKKTPLMNKLFK